VIIGFKTFFINFGKNIVLFILGLAKKNYHFAKFYYIYKRRKEIKKFRGSPVIIFQMGKVGSKTVRKSLEALSLNRPFYHSHLLTKQRIEETEQKRKKFFRTPRQSYLQRPWLNLFLRKQIEKGLDEGKKWKVITLTREPISRNISTFFENLEIRQLDVKNQYEISSDYYDIKPLIIRQHEVYRLVDIFFDRLNHDTPLEFFDRELKDVFGIDVYATEFQKKDGYQIYTNMNVDVLLIRLENLNECAGVAFKSFLNIDDFKLVNENIGSKKIYAPLYEKFKKDILLPDSYLDKFYNSKFMRHFYSEEEIENFIAKWRKTAS
jgi:hypothetical protein